MLSGDNSILQKATDAKQINDKAQIVEQARLDILAKIAEKLGQDPKEDEIKTILETYFNNVPESLEDMTKEMTTKTGGYTVTLSEVLNGVTITQSGGTTLGSKYAEENLVGRIISYECDKSIGEDNKWIILGEDSQISGNYLITTAKPIDTNVQIYLTTQEWLGYETKINTACSGFTGKLGNTTITSSRSIKLEDINNVTGYTTEYNSYSFISGDTNDYANKRVNYWYPSEDGTAEDNYFVKSQGTATWNGNSEKLHAGYYL